MTSTDTSLLEKSATDRLPVDAALEQLRHMPFEDLGFAKVDHHRALRHGMPEVIFGLGKTPIRWIAIAAALLATFGKLLVTRATAEMAERSDKPSRPRPNTFPSAGVIRVWRDRTVRGKGKIAVSAPAPAIFPSPKKRSSPPKSWATKSMPSTTSASPAFTGCWTSATAA